MFICKLYILMPKSNVGISSELTVYSFLHPNYIFCNFIPLFLRSYYNVFCEKSCKLYICPCASMFVLLTYTWLLIGLWCQSQLELLDKRQTFGNLDTKFSPSPHHSADSGSSCTSSVNIHSSHYHSVTGYNRIWTPSSSPLLTIVQRVAPAVHLLSTPTLLMITVSLDITEFGLQLHHLRNGFFTIALLGISQSSQRQAAYEGTT